MHQGHEWYIVEFESKVEAGEQDREIGTQHIPRKCARFKPALQLMRCEPRVSNPSVPETTIGAVDSIFFTATWILGARACIRRKESSLMLEFEIDDFTMHRTSKRVIHGFYILVSNTRLNQTPMFF